MSIAKNLKQLKTIIYFLLLILVVPLYSLSQPKTSWAGGGCSRAGQCINDQRCTANDIAITENIDGTVVVIKEATAPTGGACGGTDIIGGVAPPESISNITRNKTGIDAVVFFISRLINFGAIIAGIITIGNFIAAGVMYVSGGSTGDTGVHIKVKDKITYGIIGLVIIVAAYTIVGLVGLIFFGNPLFTLQPNLRGL